MHDEAAGKPLFLMHAGYVREETADAARAGKLGLTQDAADAMLQVGSSDPTSMLCAVLGIYHQTRQAAKGKSTCLAKLLLCSWQRMGKPLP